MLRKLLKSESGATAIEYGLIAALVAIVALPAMGSIGDTLQTQFSTDDSTIAGVNSGSGSGNGGNGLGNGNGNGNNGEGLGNGGANL